ncbi:cation transporter [Ramlibacter ginsenosidimutans]|uniref:Cation transporter n=1 Tax=Ramlibacter ginsenosidimutans TaxID=502333 RepID=A0A934TU07_9BURK|nr:cation diffusion facilitator family transporter [Ramlibacter ginsenosidimutans]MBK6006757.1 cation transporter [Ramlibacter ginsenosidimutans]
MTAGHDHDGHAHGQDHGHDHGHDHGRGRGHDHGHGHGHGLGHSHAHAPASFGRAFAIGCVLNIGFVIAEWTFGALAHSLALIADAVHNFGDVLALLLAWGAAGLARRPPSERFTYGLRGSSILAALMNAGALVLVTGALGWEALRRLPHPGTVDGVIVIWVALAGVVVNGVTAWLFMGGRDDLNIRGVYLHMAADAAVSLAVAIAGAAVMFTGWNWLDPALTLAVSAVILWSSWDLLRQSLRLALQAVPAGIRTGEVRDWLGALPGVTEVHDLHIWAMSTSENALTAHLVIPAGHPGDAFLHDACQRLSQHFAIHHATLQIEVASTGAACALAPQHVV